jgi:predicted aspartyl protease
MLEQRNAYKGAPPRPWVSLEFIDESGQTIAIEALADTGNPCALVVGPQIMGQFNLGSAPGMTTNFGQFEGGWLRVVIDEIEFDEDVLAYSSEAVLSAVQASHTDFGALVGLPLLQKMEFGGNRDSFWIRKAE